MDDARLIYRRTKNYYGEGDGGRSIPKGWKALGEGGYRHCYLSPDKVVYKVCYDYYTAEEAELNENELEILTYRDYRSGKLSFDGWRLARTKGYRFMDGDLEITVNGQEYISGVVEESPAPGPTYKFYTDYLQKAFEAFALEDWHNGNYLLAKNGKRIIIDMAR